MRPLVLSLVAAIAFAAPATEPWERPVAGPVVRPFAAPRTAYGPGHRGVELAAPPGTPVRAARAGTVAFAGRVGRELYVVVAHPGDLRTTYSHLRAIRVRRGETVRAGEVLGRSLGTTVYVGLRHHDRYVDPAPLLVGPRAPRLRLAPLTRCRNWCNCCGGADGAGR